MGNPRMRLSREVRLELERHSLDYKLVAGSKHTKIMVAGRLLAVVPRTQKGNTTTAKNILASIRRFGRGA